MLIRTRSKDGNFRFQFEATSSVSELLAKILETTVDADPSSICISDRPRGNEVNIHTLVNRNLQELGMSHGDLIFVSYKSIPAPGNAVENGMPSTQVAKSPSGHLPESHRWESVTEHSIDTYYRKMDGKIARSRDTQFCKHGANAMCDHCMPLEPYDSVHHSKHNIKHLSYHAYLCKISPPSTTLSSSASLPPLAPLSYKVKKPCPTGNHPPWPAGICTGCQPSAITLQPQPFRMVDHLEFSSPEIIDRFLTAWRSTATQRFGWLLGRYEPYDEVPMGIKAVVEAIHEPPQEGEVDGLSLGLPWADEQRIIRFAACTSRPLTVVGQIFTDLTPDSEDKTKLIYKRHQGSYFLSSLETIWAASQQANHPTASRSSPTGYFSSRFVTAILSGTEEGGVDVQAYQVSEQACAMVQADMIQASVDPGIVRINEEDGTEDNARYVPEVFFRYKNEYGLDVKKSAKPCFPVEYLLVNVTHGFPKSPAPIFRTNSFAIENRPGLEDQDMNHVIHKLNELNAYDIGPSNRGEALEARVKLATWLSDWHLVSFLGTTGLFSEKELDVLAKTATATNLEDPAVLDSLSTTDGWQNLVTIAKESAVPQRPIAPPPSSVPDTGMNDIPQELFDQVMEDGGSGKVCPHCTFENPSSNSDCEVCGLPLT